MIPLCEDLLPKLQSGEVRMKEAEAVVGKFGLI